MYSIKFVAPYSLHFHQHIPLAFDFSIVHGATDLHPNHFLESSKANILYICTKILDYFHYSRTSKSPKNILLKMTLFSIGIFTLNQSEFRIVILIVIICTSHNSILFFSQQFVPYSQTCLNMHNPMS